MQQYAFRMTAKRNGQRYQADCTAPNAYYAWLQIYSHYAAEFNIISTPIAVNPAHHCGGGELNASNMTADDAAYVEGLIYDKELLKNVRAALENAAA